MNAYLAIFVGGGLGSLSRYGLSKIMTSIFPKFYAVGTLVCNIFATIILGFILLFFIQKYNISNVLKLGLATGFCGGFSTFSTFSYETFVLIKEQNYVWAVANVVLSIILALIVLYILSKSELLMVND